MKLYKLTNYNLILKLLNNEYRVSIPKDLGNVDYQEYLKWLGEGNTPEFAESIDELYNRLYSEVTNKTSSIINRNGFVYENINFYTDAVSQQNFTALLIMKNNLTYPYQIWDGNSSVIIENSSKLEIFCGLVFQYIESKRSEGKTIRDSLIRLENEDDIAYRNRLENFIDPR